MKVTLTLVFVGLLFAALFVQSGLSTPPALTGEVVRVYDGDTIKVKHVGKVRLLGIDTPEWKASDRDNYFIRQGISEPTLRRVATASREFVTRVAVGEVVTLHTDRDTRDRHGRLLAYVYLPDGRLLNSLLLKEGMAVVYRRFDFSLKSDFINVERTALKQFLGIWADLK